jgi:hypothetical protein
VANKTLQYFHWDDHKEMKNNIHLSYENERDKLESIFIRSEVTHKEVQSEHSPKKKVQSERTNRSFAIAVSYIIRVESR